MNDTEYHAKIKRLPIGKIPHTHRPMMSEEEMKDLLTGEIWIEEKIDGQLLHKKEVISWGDMKSLKVDAFYENLKVRHSIFYDALPAFEVFLNYAINGRIFGHPFIKQPLGVPHIPVIFLWPRMTPEEFQRDLPKYLARKSAFATNSSIEGIVIKNYPKQLFGKVVSLEFMEGIEDQENYRKQPKRMNRLKI